MERFFHNDIYNYRTDWETFGLKDIFNFLSRRTP